MSNTTIFRNKSWEYNLTLEPVVAVPGKHVFQIDSRFLTGNHPSESVTQIQCVLPRDSLRLIRDEIDNYLRSN